MPYLNDLSSKLEAMAENRNPQAIPELLDLVHRLLSERHAYRFVLEPVAYGRCADLNLIQARAHDVCEEFRVKTLVDTFAREVPS